MSLFNTVTLTAQKRKNSYVNGKSVIENDGEPFTIRGSLQPDTGEKLQTLLEGRRASSIYKIYTNTYMNTVNQNNNTVSDVVFIDGYEYEVIDVAKWGNGLIGHYKIICMREKE